MKQRVKNDLKEKQVGVAGSLWRLPALASGRTSARGVDGQPMLARMMKLMRSVTKDLKLSCDAREICGIWSAACGGQLARAGTAGWNSSTALEDSAQKRFAARMESDRQLRHAVFDAGLAAIPCESRCQKQSASRFSALGVRAPNRFALAANERRSEVRSGFERGVRQSDRRNRTVRAEVLDEQDWKRLIAQGGCSGI